VPSRNPTRPATVRLAPLLHALFFVASATQSAIVPLLPRLGRVYDLSPSADALLLAAPGLATLAISLPAGALADRLGARRLTIAAGVLMALAALAQAAPSYPVLLAGRLAFGLAYGIVWTTGVAWMSSAHTGKGSPHLGTVATSAAVGLVAGPAIGGVLADAFGLASPFLAVAAIAAALTLALRHEPDADTNRPTDTERTTSVRTVMRVASRHPGVMTAAVVLAIGGAVGGVTQLLVPLQLHQAGFSVSATGLAFSAAAGLYIVVSAIVVRLGHRATTTRRAKLAGLLLALSPLPAAFQTGAVALIGVLLLTTAPRAFVSTVAYPLATDSAEQAELGAGVVIGLLNGTWAAGLVLAPLLAGAVEQIAGPAAAYVAAIVPGVLGALALTRLTRVKPSVEPSQALQVV
jgi:predicted MFS family arabinose efflux permease